jgi:hypothetical protein
MRQHKVFKRHVSRFERIADIAGADDWQYDPWGTSMGLFFDVASVLDMSDVAGDVTPEPFARWGYQRARWGYQRARWGYQRAPFTVPAIGTVAARGDDFHEGEFADDYSYAQVALAMAVRDDELSQDDLIYAGNVLDRYTSLLRRAGRDY